MLRNKNSIVRCWAIKNARLSATEKKMLLFSFNLAFYKRKTLARIMKQMEINNVILCNMTLRRIFYLKISQTADSCETLK